MTILPITGCEVIVPQLALCGNVRTNVHSHDVSVMIHRCVQRNAELVAPIGQSPLQHYSMEKISLLGCSPIVGYQTWLASFTPHFRRDPWTDGTQVRRTRAVTSCSSWNSAENKSEVVSYLSMVVIAVKIGLDIAEHTLDL